MALNPVQIDRFEEAGYLQLDGLLSQDELNPVIWEFEGVVDREARAQKARGSLTDLHDREPFERRIALLAAQVPAIAYFLSPHRVLGPAMFNLMRNPRILDVLEPLVGGEILCHPTHVVRPRMRDRPKGEERWRPTDGVPWHQDAGVLGEEADETLLITVWIPLTAADRENGCLLVIPGSHRFGVRLHEASTNYGIPQSAVPPGDPVALPIEPGGVILFSNLVCHSGLPSHSDRVRWSIDLRYQHAAQPTGHPYFAGHLVRSRENPAAEPTYPQWVSMWENQLVHDEPWPAIPRWPGSHAV